MSLFTFGANNTKVCPSPTVAVVNAEACEVAADAAGRPYGGTVALLFVPMNCVWLSAGGSFYYNTGTGSVPDSEVKNPYSHEATQTVCAGAPDASYRRQHKTRGRGECVRALRVTFVSLSYIANTHTYIVILVITYT